MEWWQRRKAMWAAQQQAHEEQEAPQTGGASSSAHTRLLHRRSPASPEEDEDWFSEQEIVETPGVQEKSHAPVKEILDRLLPQLPRVTHTLPKCINSSWV